MTTPQDSNLATRFVGTTFRGYLKAAVKTVVILLVIAGIGRSLQFAWTDIHSTEHKIALRLEEIDKRIESTTDALQRKELEQEKDSVSKTRMDWKNVQLYWVPVSIVSGFFAILMPGILWWRALRNFHSFPPFWPTQAAYSVGSLGKYVPGKAMVLILRSGAMRRWGTPVGVSVTATIVETLISLSAAGAIGAVTLSAANPPRWLFQISLASALLSLVPIIPPVFNRLLILIAKRKKVQESENQDTALQPYIGWQDMFHFWCLTAVGWGLMGISLFFAVACVSPTATSGLASSSLHLLILSTATATLAFVIGFLSMLPGGAGVRELIVTMLLAPMVGYAPALAAAVIYRLSSLAAELLMACLTSLAIRHTKPHLD